MGPCSIKGCGGKGTRLGYCANCRRKMARRDVHKSGLTEVPPHPTVAPIGPDELKLIVKYSALGMSSRAIGKQLCVDQTTVCRHLKALKPTPSA